MNATVRRPLLDGRLRPPGAARRAGRFVTADERYIRDSILLPQSQVVAGYKPVMPTFQGHISEDDLLKIIAYIKSIGKNERVETMSDRRSLEPRADELPDRQLRRQVVAADDRPQADRASST